jgi:hypothetical protein
MLNPDEEGWFMKHVYTVPAALRRLVLIGLLALLALLPAALLHADSFTEIARKWEDFFCLEGERCNMGDFNGDGLDDIIAFVRDDENGGQAGDVYVALSQGDAFGAEGNQWADVFCLADEICRVGDFNGDTLDDVAAFVRSSDPDRAGDVYVSLSNGSEFAAQGDQWEELFCLGNEVCATGDFNGDGLDDIISFVQDTQSGGQEGDVYVALSDGSSFGRSGNQWSERFCLADAVCRVGDVNGDNNDDIISFVRDSAAGEEGAVYVALSNGVDGFGPRTLWNDLFCIGDETCRVGDFNGDGADDILAYVRDTQTGADRGDVYVALSNRRAFVDPSIWQRLFCLEDEICRVGDVNGDERADGVAFVRGQDTGEDRGDVFVVLSTEEDLPPLPRDSEFLYIPLVIR